MDFTRRGLLGTAAMAAAAPGFVRTQATPSRGTYDKLLATTPADQAFRPLADGKCSLVT